MLSYVSALMKNLYTLRNRLARTFSCYCLMAMLLMLVLQKTVIAEFKKSWTKHVLPMHTRDFATKTSLLVYYSSFRLAWNHLWVSAALTILRFHLPAAPDLPGHATRTQTNHTRSCQKKVDLSKENTAALILREQCSSRPSCLRKQLC
jgi:hypothetical protein